MDKFTIKSGDKELTLEGGSLEEVRAVLSSEVAYQFVQFMVPVHLAPERVNLQVRDSFALPPSPTRLLEGVSHAGLLPPSVDPSSTPTVPASPLSSEQSIVSPTPTPLPSHFYADTVKQPVKSGFKLPGLSLRSIPPDVWVAALVLALGVGFSLNRDRILGVFNSIGGGKQEVKSTAPKPTKPPEVKLEK